MLLLLGLVLALPLSPLTSLFPLVRGDGSLTTEDGLPGAFLFDGFEKGDLSPLALELGQVTLLLLLLLQELLPEVLLRVLAEDGRRGSGRRVLLIKRAGKVGEESLLASGDGVGRVERGLRRPEGWAAWSGRTQSV